MSRGGGWRSAALPAETDLPHPPLAEPRTETEPILVVEDQPNVRSLVRGSSKSLVTTVPEVKRPTRRDAPLRGLYGSDMSGYTDNLIVHRSVLDPNVNYLQKPFTPEALSFRIREVLGMIARVPWRPPARIGGELSLEGHSMVPRILLALIAAAGLATPQEIERTLTNADISAMLKAGLAESTIARAIGLATVRGTTRFETSSQALIDLKNQGATARVLDAMLAADALPKRMLPSTIVPGLPAEQGVYYRAVKGWVDLASILLWPEINTNWRGMTAIEDRRYVIAGAEAGLRVNEAIPSFHVRGMDPQRVWQLIRLNTKRNYREWRTVPEEVFRFARSMEPRQVRELQLEFRAVAHDVFELRPLTALEPGQYALTMLVPGQRWVLVAYEFAVVGGQSP